MKIISFRKQNDIDVQFLDDMGAIVNTTYSNFSRGWLKNPYDKRVFGIGCLGEGSYLTDEEFNGKRRSTVQYMVWKGMLRRCYDQNNRHRERSYEGCEVCKEWHNFQIFAKWYDENFYDIGDGKRIHLDKDIINTGNRIYCPEKCIFVPQRINMLFTIKSNKTGLPSGVKKSGKNFFYATYNGKYLGKYNSIDKAVVAHKNAKKIHIKNIAEEYKTKIPQKVFNALITWEGGN